MGPRPRSVTILAWVLIVLSALGVYVETMIALMVPGTPIEKTAFALAALKLCILIAGIGILKGQSWARLLYFSITPISIVLQLANDRVPQALVGELIPLVLCVVYFRRPAARAFLARALSADEPRGET